MAAKKKIEEGLVQVRITPPDLREFDVRISGKAYVQNRFSEKARRLMKETHEAGSAAKRKGKEKPKRDFEAEYEAAFHRGPKGEYGMPSSAFRKAMISVCKLVGYKMTLAKMSIFVVEDFFDERDGTPLTKLSGKPKKLLLPVVNAGPARVVDLRIRPIWYAWAAKVRIRYDAGQFSQEDVMNLLNRVGAQAGIGEGRADSKNSAGMGWGHFEIDRAVRVVDERAAA